MSFHILDKPAYLSLCRHPRLPFNQDEQTYMWRCYRNSLKAHFEAIHDLIRDQSWELKTYEPPIYGLATNFLRVMSGMSGIRYSS